jgi:flagellar L-ring protein precursor FlgH
VTRGPIRVVAVAALLLAAGCARPRVDVAPAPSVPPPSYVVASAQPGAIFRDGAYRPLFEDRRARFVGDLLTIQINERLNAQKSASSSAEKSGSVGAAATITRVPLLSSLSGRSIDAKSDNKFEGKGETGASNLFTGTIAVTVVDVLPNGNLVVAGDKQIGLNRNAETVRFSGVVNPVNILPGNAVSSTQVADARLDWRGNGYIDEAQIMGWLSRAFLSVLPF